MSFLDSLFTPNIEELSAKKDVLGLIKALDYQNDKYDNQKIRQSSAEALGKIGDARAVEPLIVALKDNVSNVRYSAAEALGQLGDARAIEPLYAALGTCETVAKALGQIGGVRAVELLVVALKNKNNDVRKVAAEMLVKNGSLAFESLVAMLGDPYNEYYVNDALNEILPQIAQQISDVALRERAIERFVVMMKQNPAPDGLNYLDVSAKSMRYSAARILNSLGWKPGQDEIAYWYYRRDYKKLIEIGAPAVEFLIEQMRGTPLHDRSLIKALAEIGDTRAVEPLIARLSENQDFQVRNDITEALGLLGDARAVGPIIAAWKTPADYTPGGMAGDASFYLATALEKIGPPAVETLIAELKSDTILSGEKFPSGGKLYISVLGNIGDARAVEPLITVLNHFPLFLDEVTMEALGKIGDPRAAESLIAVFKNSEGARTRHLAAKALEKLGYSEKALSKL